MQPPVGALSDPHAEIFRRILVGVVTALLTARMLAPGEDPGVLQNTSGSTNLLLPLLWVLAAVGLAAWRLWSRQGDWRGGWVEAALLTVVVLAFVSAEFAAYRHPARIIAWEWLTFFIIVCLVRQLTVAPGDQQALLAVLLAGAASLSAQALSAEGLNQGAFLHLSSTATFAQPGAFLGWLALFLPAMLTAHYLCRYGRVHPGLTTLTAIFAILGAAAFVIVAVDAFHSSGAAWSSLLDTWRTTGKMIVDRPLFGVGAGNFSRAFPRFQDHGSGAPAEDPHNFALEIAATLGVVALLAVLTALGAFFFRAGRWLFRPAPAAPPPPSEAESRVRWEYYIGAMCGLVLGFILRVSAREHTPNEILEEGILSCVRCLLWLTAFILYERVPWSGRVRVGTLMAGVAAMLLVLCMNPGFGLPSVAVPLWAVVALALNGLPQPSYPFLDRLSLTRILPLPAAIAVALLYFFIEFVPVTSCSARIQTGARDSRIYAHETLTRNPSALRANLHIFLNGSPLGRAALEDPDDARPKVLLARWTNLLWQAHPSEDGLKTASVFYARKAEQVDPQSLEGYDAEYQFRLDFARRLQASAPLPESDLPAFALGSGYRVFLNETRWPDPDGHSYAEQKKRYRDVLASSAKPDEIDPAVGREPVVQYLQAAEVLERFLPNAPNNPGLRYALAETLFKAWEDERCREQAVKALELDAGHSLLTDEQRRRLEVWKDLARPAD